MTDEIWPATAAALCAIVLMPLAIGTRVHNPHPPSGLQDIHKSPTSRLGGGVIFLAYAIGIAVAILFARTPSRPVLLLLACAIPVVVAGLWEDVTRRLSPGQRLFAAIASAVLAFVFAGGAVARVDLPVFDAWLAWTAAALLVTCFMVAGACNALNLIDGVHGLAAGTALVMFLGMAGAAATVGDNMVFVEAAVMVGALLGFLCWNYPRGRIFMGDGGAYFVGFIYAELSMQIVSRNEHISAWFVIMLAAFPIVETLYSIYRRKFHLRQPSMQPDRLHLHSLIHKRIAIPAERGLPDPNHDRANARVAPRLWLHSLVCCAEALIFHDNTAVLITGLVLYALFYHFYYRYLLSLEAGEPAATLSPFIERSDAGNG